MRFQVLRSKNPTQPYFWRIVSESGQTVAVSGNYVAKASAIAMVQAVMRSSGSATKVARRLGSLPAFTSRALGFLSSCQFLMLTVMDFPWE